MICSTLHHTHRLQIMVKCSLHSSTIYMQRLKPDMYEPEKVKHVFVAKNDDEKPLNNAPFIKNLFVGNFNKRMLVFPEVCDKEELADLEAMCEPIERFYDNVDSTQIDRDGQIPSQVLDDMKNLGLFGLQIPEKYGGLEFNATKYARIAEITGRDGALSVTLAAHQAIGLKGILLAGTDEQKEKYLPSLASGERVAAFCLTEPSSGSDAASITTTATQTADGKHYRINGSKIWITNGGIADVFTVFAKTRIKNKLTEEYENQVTAFIVERSFGGVVSGKPEDKLGIRGSNTCEVIFDTLVPVENIIGQVGGGFKVAMNILNSGRFSMGTSCAGALKKLIEQTMAHAIARKQFDRHLIEFEMIQEKLSRMHTAVYAMEAMAYMTAGVIDAYREPDTSIEAAIVKVYSSEQTGVVVNECLQILGGLGYMKDYPYERAIRDARILPIFEGTNEILRLYISLTGLQHAGVIFKDVLRKMRNPFNHFWELRTYYQERKSAARSNTWLLSEQVHPLLEKEAQNLEKYSKFLKIVVEDLLDLHREGMMERQMELSRLANIAIDLYGMTAVLARASRSLSIGLPNNNHEMYLAQIFCYEASQRLMRNINELKSSASKGDKEENIDELHRQVTKQMVKSAGCFTSSALARNW